MGIAPSVHLWFSRKGKKFDATRRYPGPRPDTASRILADVKVPFIIRGHGLRNFVERTTPGEQYKELANWFGLDPLLKVQQNLRNLRRAMKSKAESTSEVEERSRDLQRETNNEISEWDDQEICRWVNEKLLNELDSTLTFLQFSEQDDTFTILSARRDTEQEKLGLAQLRRLSKLAEALSSPLDGAQKKLHGKIPEFEQAVSRLGITSVREKEERSRASNAVFSRLWAEAKELFDKGAVIDACPVCDTSLESGPHSSHDGIRASITEKLIGLETYRKAEERLEFSREQVNQLLQQLKSSLDNLGASLADTEFECGELVNYSQALEHWKADNVVPDSNEVVSSLLTFHNSIADKVRKIEEQQGENTYAKALDKVNKLLEIRTDLDRIVHTKAQMELLRIELDRQVLIADNGVIEHIQTLIGKLQGNVQAIYREIQGSKASSPPIRIELPDQDGIDKQRDQLLIDFSSNRQGVVPGGYLSDSQVHTLGLALRLAAIKMFNYNAPILVLDDIVTSYDADHRKATAGAIAKFLSEFQIVLATHDEQFFNLLKDQLPQSRWVFKRITEIREGFGPVFHDHQTSDEVIQAKLDAGESAGAEIRQAEEEWLLKICREFGAKVVIRPIDRAFQYDRAELASALAGLLKGAKIKLPKSPTSSNGILASLQSGVVENLSSHFSDNPYKSNSLGDGKARWDEFKFFRDLFKCPSCGKRRFKRPVVLSKPVCYYCETQFAFSIP